MISRTLLLPVLAVFALSALAAPFETLDIGGGYASSGNGGLHIDSAGNLTSDGSATFDGGVNVTVSNLEDIGDVDLTGIASGYTIIYNGTTFYAGLFELLNLGDVNANTVSDRQGLAWDADPGEFVPANFVESENIDTEAELETFLTDVSNIFTDDDLASPGAIGGTTPAAATFTTLTSTLDVVVGGKIQLEGNLMYDEGTAENALWQQNTTNATATRHYLIPKGTPTGTRSGIKLFATDWVSDSTNYADFNVTVTDALTDISGSGFSAILNSKVNGSITDPMDIAFVFQDGAELAGRAIYNSGNSGWMFGDSTTNYLSTHSVAQFSRDIFFPNTFGIRFGNSSQTANSKISVDASGNMVFTIGGALAMTGNSGSLVHEGDMTAKGGDVKVGVSGTTRGLVTAYRGASTNTPAALMVESSDGTDNYYFAGNDGTLRRHTALPTANTDGTAVGGGVSAYATMDNASGTMTEVDIADTWYTMTGYTATVTDGSLVTIATSVITVAEAGKYAVTLSGEIASSTLTDVVWMGISVNDASVSTTSGNIYIKSTGADAVQSMTKILSLSASNTLRVKVMNDTSGTDIDFENMAVTVTRVGT